MLRRIHWWEVRYYHVRKISWKHVIFITSITWWCRDRFSSNRIVQKIRKKVVYLTVARHSGNIQILSFQRRASNNGQKTVIWLNLRWWEKFLISFISRPRRCKLRFIVSVENVREKETRKEERPLNCSPKVRKVQRFVRGMIDVIDWKSRNDWRIIKRV